MKKKNVIAMLGALLVAGGISVFLLTTAGESNEPSSSVRQEAQIPEEILKDRGPRPETKRLREGAKQVETRDDARAELESALARVSGEIVQATSAEDRERLEHKKALIMRALER